MRRTVLMYGAVAAIALGVACGDKANSPTSPTGVTPAASGVNPDGSTLKVTAPTPVSPANGATLDATVGSPTLTVQPATSKFVTASLQTRFRVLNPAGTVVADQKVSAASLTLSNLEPNTVYRWQARGETYDAYGPWSPEWSFKTPEQPKGYIRGNEVYDPLTECTPSGQPVTIGKLRGPWSCIPGVGAKTEAFDSFIQYDLGATLAGGEFSMIIGDIATISEGGKTKVFSMCQGNCVVAGTDPNNMTTNPYRLTVEKRNTGHVAFRLLAGSDDNAAETVGDERVVVNFSSAMFYLWRATWSSEFRVTITTNAGNGTPVYNFGKPFKGVYAPSPHVGFLGTPPTRGGPADGTAPGNIYRHVWISSRPRPTYANK